MFGGGRKNNNNDGQSLSSVMTPENPPASKGKGGGNVMGFDPEGLNEPQRRPVSLTLARMPPRPSS